MPLFVKVAVQVPFACCSPVLVFSVRVAGRPPQVPVTFDGLGLRLAPFFAVAPPELLRRATSQAAGQGG